MTHCVSMDNVHHGHFVFHVALCPPFGGVYHVLSREKITTLVLAASGSKPHLV